MGNQMMIASEDGEFPVEGPLGFTTLDNRIPVEFDGQSGEGDIYRCHKGRLFLVRYGTEKAEVVDWG